MLLVSVSSASVEESFKLLIVFRLFLSYPVLLVNYVAISSPKGWDKAWDILHNESCNEYFK